MSDNTKTITLLRNAEAREMIAKTIATHMVGSDASYENDLSLADEILKIAQRAPSLEIIDALMKSALRISDDDETSDYNWRDDLLENTPVVRRDLPTKTVSEYQVSEASHESPSLVSQDPDYLAAIRKEALDDCTTHRSAWIAAFDQLIDLTDPSTQLDTDDQSYYRHERNVLVRTLDALTLTEKHILTVAAEEARTVTLVDALRVLSEGFDIPDDVSKNAAYQVAQVLRSRVQILLMNHQQALRMRP